MKKLAVFASGGGSNAEAIIRHLKNSKVAEVSLIVSNNPEAGVIGRAHNHNIPVYIHTKEDAESGKILAKLQQEKIDFIALAGYLKKIGSDLIHAYPNRIVNIHPALLPDFGGKGMYGMRVHEAVVKAGEKLSGPTIHYVNEDYDEGAIIEQHRCKINEDDTASDVQKKVLKLEHEYYPKCIERLIKEQL